MKARTGRDYVPKLTTYNVSSRGRKHRPKGQKTEREHHFFSDLEYFFFMIFDFAGNVQDIREQYQLSTRLTKRLASDRNVRHNQKPRTRKIKPITTDLYVTFNDGTKPLACSVKPADLLRVKRNIEVLELERAAWEHYNLRWCLLTEKELNMDLVSNLFELRQHYKRTVGGSVQKFLKTFRAELKKQHPTIEALLISVAQLLSISKADAVQHFKHALARKYIRFDYAKLLTTEMSPREFEMGHYNDRAS